MDIVVKKLMSIFSKCCHCKKCDPPKENDDDDVDMYENEMTMEEEDADEFDDECGILGNTFICCRTKSNDSKLEDEGFVDESEKTDLMSTKSGYEKTDWTSTRKHGDVVRFQPENKIFRGVLGMPIKSLAVQNNSSDCVGQKKSLDYHTQELCSQMPLLYLVSEV